MKRQAGWLVKSYNHPIFRVAEWLLVTAAIGFAVFLVDVYDPGNTGYIFCATRRIFGIYCPGCGMTRAVHQLLQGNFIRSLQYNVLTIPTLAFLGLVYAYYFGKRLGLIRQNWYPRISGKALIIVGVITLVYAVVRNLPFGAWLLP